MQPFATRVVISTNKFIKNSIRLRYYQYSKIHEYSSLSYLQHKVIKNPNNFNIIKRSSFCTETKEQSDDNEPLYDHDPTREQKFDPSFDNLIHGVFNREDFTKRQGRTESEVGSLGRLFLYQYNCCPFCGKIKSVLDYYNIPYSLIECHPVRKNQLPNRKKFLHDRTVPILLATKPSYGGPSKYNIDQKLVYKSSVIIDTLLEYLTINGNMPQSEYNRSKSDIVSAWQEWMDNNLIPHIYAAIDSDSYDIAFVSKLLNDHKNREGKSNSVDIMFRYLKEFEKFETMAITTFPIQEMCAQLFHHQAKQIRYKYGIPNGYDVEYLKNVISEWHNVVKISFHGGSKPDLADLMCFGIFRTFNNIPFMQDLIKTTGLNEWYETVEEMVGKHSCVTHA